MTGSAAAKSNKADLFGESLIDLMDAPTSVPTERRPSSNASNEVDLFADATFVSAAPQVEGQVGFHSQVRFSYHMYPNVSLMSSFNTGSGLYVMIQLVSNILCNSGDRNYLVPAKKNKCVSERVRD